MISRLNGTRQVLVSYLPGTCAEGCTCCCRGGGFCCGRGAGASGAGVSLCTISFILRSNSRTRSSAQFAFSSASSTWCCTTRAASFCPFKSSACPFAMLATFSAWACRRLRARRAPSSRCRITEVFAARWGCERVGEQFFPSPATSLESQLFSPLDWPYISR